MRKNKKEPASSLFLFFPHLALLIAYSHYIPLIGGRKAGNAKIVLQAYVIQTIINKVRFSFLLRKGKSCRRKRRVAFLLLMSRSRRSR
jgi:hypothetical protein